MPKVARRVALVEDSHTVNWVGNNLDLIGELTLIHLRHSIVALIAGFVLSVPLGWVAWRYRLVRSGVITITGCCTRSRRWPC